MITKQKGDIAEQAVILKVLKLGWNILKPVGDRLAYDLVIDIDGYLLKIQVKSAWWDAIRNNYVVDNRRTKTNRRQMVRSLYKETDFDFAIILLMNLICFMFFRLLYLLLMVAKSTWSLPTSVSESRVARNFKMPGVYLQKGQH